MSISDEEKWQLFKMEENMSSSFGEGIAYLKALGKYSDHYKELVPKVIKFLEDNDLILGYDDEDEEEEN